MNNKTHNKFSKTKKNTGNITKNEQQKIRIVKNLEKMRTVNSIASKTIWKNINKNEKPSNNLNEKQ